MKKFVEWKEDGNGLLPVRWIFGHEEKVFFPKEIAEIYHAASQRYKKDTSR